MFPLACQVLAKVRLELGLFLNGISRADDRSDVLL
jgi:hypothetical protein